MELYNGMIGEVRILNRIQAGTVRTNNKLGPHSVVGIEDVYLPPHSWRNEGTVIQAEGDGAVRLKAQPCYVSDLPAKLAHNLLFHDPSSGPSQHSVHAR